MTTEERKAEDARFRQEYPLFAQYPELIYLDNAATTLHKPPEVAEAVKNAILTQQPRKSHLVSFRQNQHFMKNIMLTHFVVFMSWPSLLQSIMRRLEQR